MDARRSRQSSRSRQSPAPDEAARKEQALLQAEDAMWQIPRSLDGIKREDFNPVALALQLMDTSSLGKSYDEFRQSFDQLNESLDGIVGEYYGGFNDSILTFSGLHDRIHAASASVNAVKGSLQRVRRMMLEERGSLDQMYAKSNQLGAIVALLKRLEEVKRVRDEISAFTKEKKFLAAAGKLVQDMQFVFDPELDPIEALSGLRQQLEKEKADLIQRLIDELHSHIYLKSVYCERRMGIEGEDADGDGAEAGGAQKPGARPGRQRIRRARKARNAAEPRGGTGSGGGDDEANAEADSFAYVEMLLESLATLDTISEAMQEIKSSVSLELSRLIDSIVGEVEERNRVLVGRSRLAGQGGSGGGGGGGADAGDDALRAQDADREVLSDFARILFARLESVLEYHDYVLDVVHHLDRNDRYSLTSPVSPPMMAMPPPPPPPPSARRARAYAIGDVWAAIKTEVLALLKDYLIIEDAQAGPADIAHAGGAAASGTRDLFRMEKNDELAAAADALYSQIERHFQSLTVAIADRRRELTTPAVIDEFADQQNSLQHKLLVEPSIEHAPVLLTMALQFTRRIASMLAPSAVGSPSAALSPAVRRSVAGELLSPGSPPSLSPSPGLGDPDSDADEYLQAFFRKVFLPHAEAQAMRRFDAVTSATDAFDAGPSSPFGGRPVFRSAAAIEPLLRDFGALLNNLDMFRGENWAIVLQLATRFYERCLELFQDTVRSPENQTYISVRWSEHMEMQLLFDRKLRLGSAAPAADVDKEIRQEEALKADRSLNPYELIFDVKRLVCIAQLHQTLEWLLARLREISDDRAAVLAKHEGPSAAALLKRHEAEKARVVNCYLSLSVQCLMVLRIEVRTHCLHYLDLVTREGSYDLDGEAMEPEPYIQTLNADMSTIEEKMEACLPADKLALVFGGISVLMAHVLIANARHIRSLSADGNKKMIRNILALQQNLTNIALSDESGLDRARKFYELYDLGADGILRHVAEHGPAFSFDDYRRMLGFVYGAASGHLDPARSAQYEDHVRRLHDLLSQQPKP
ncbi:exocyst subunit [Coemansia javaensis]|uniref:Exocyst complex component Sec8 n=1 Tax=Coemansia javaensis TaxID=2761396 RepID=A0A9W8HIP6_9FUNG|nr:exocyst subunit [Coemansia javaensis]